MDKEILMASGAAVQQLPRGYLLRLHAESDPAELGPLIEAQGREIAALAKAFNRRLDSIELEAGRRGMNPGVAGGDREDDATQFFGLLRAHGNPVGEGTAEDLEVYRAAFSSYLRRDERGLSPDFRAAMSVGSDPDGGYFAPPEMSREVIRRTFETSPMRQICSAVPIGAGSLEIPVDPNDLPAGSWVGERQSRSETDTSELMQQQIFVHEQYAFPFVTQTLLDDSAIDIEMWLADKVADRLARTENLAFVSGDGFRKPRGFLDYAASSVTTADASRPWGVLQYVPSGAAGAFPKVGGGPADDAGKLIDLIYSLKSIYRANARFVMNRATAAVVRKLRDADGRFLWREGDLELGQPPRLLGYPVTELEDMPNIGSDSFSIAFGDFRAGYLIVDRLGLRVLRDPFTKKPYVGFYTTKRVGGDVTDFDAIKLMKFAAS